MIKRAFKAFLFLFLPIAIACLSAACQSIRETKEEAVAWMGDEAIELPLFKKAMNMRLYDVRVRFNGQYGIELDDKPESWEKVYEGQSPLKLLREISLEEAEKIKAALIIAKERGLIKTINYEDIQNYDNDNLKNAFKAAFDQSEIPSLPIYGKDVFLSFMEMVEYVLKKDIRDDIDEQEAEKFLKRHGANYLKDYIRIGPEEEKDEYKLIRDIAGNARKFSVMKDLIQEEKYEELINEKIKACEVRINEEVYNAAVFWQ